MISLNTWAFATIQTKEERNAEIQSMIEYCKDRMHNAPDKSTYELFEYQLSQCKEVLEVSSMVLPDTPDEED